MRDKRLRAEMGIQYLKAHYKRRQNSSENLAVEKDGAKAHYKDSNMGFDRNEKLYADQLARKINKQAVIHVNALSPD